MSRDKFRRAVDDKVRPKLNGLLEARRHHRAVHLYQRVLGVSDAADVRDVNDALHGVRRALDHDKPRVVRDHGGQVGGPLATGHVHVPDLDVVSRGHLPKEKRMW